MAKNPQFDEDEGEGPQNSCKDCRYFDVDRESIHPSDDLLCMCIHPDLEEYELFVSGDSGCSNFDMYHEDDDFEDEENED